MFRGAEGSDEFREGFRDNPIAWSATDRTDPSHSQCCGRQVLHRWIPRLSVVSRGYPIPEAGMILSDSHSHPPPDFRNLLASNSCAQADSNGGVCTGSPVHTACQVRSIPHLATSRGCSAAMRARHAASGTSQGAQWFASHHARFPPGDIRQGEGRSEGCIHICSDQ
jgi:hypothetical protein